MVYKVFNDLMMISNEEWVDLKNLKRNKEIVINGETLKYLGMGENVLADSMYSVSFSLSTDQYKLISEYNKTCSSVERDQYFHILNMIQPRDNLRYQDISINLL